MAGTAPASPWSARNDDDPGQRRVPVDRDLVGRVRLDVVDVAELRRAAGEHAAAANGSWMARVRAAGQRAGRRVRQVRVELVGVRAGCAGSATRARRSRSRTSWFSALRPKHVVHRLQRRRRGTSRSPVRSYAVASTTSVVEDVAVGAPDVAVRVAGAYGSPYAWPRIVGQVAVGAGDHRGADPARSAAGSPFGTVARSRRPSAATRCQPKPPASKTSPVCVRRGGARRPGTPARRW